MPTMCSCGWKVFANSRGSVPDVKVSVPIGSDYELIVRGECNAGQEFRPTAREFPDRARLSDPSDRESGAG